MSGRGKEFERHLTDLAADYERRRLLVMRKLDPPTRVIGPGKIIYMRSPFVDFSGSWTERAGRSIHIEAKETHDNKLGVGASASSGITVNQVHNLHVWHQAGAVAAVCWKSPDANYLLPITVIDELTRRSGLKHIKASEVPQICLCGGDGRIDLIGALRRLF